MASKWGVWNNKTEKVEQVEAKAEPNYHEMCDTCDASPTVELVNSNGDVVKMFDLCGPCLFGEADCIDPENWNGNNG